MNLTDREKKFLIGGGVFLVLVALWFAGQFVRNSLSEFSNDMETLQNEEMEIQKLGMEYRQLKDLKAGNKIDLDRMAVVVEELLRAYGIYEGAKIDPSDNMIERKYKKRTIRIVIQESKAVDVLKFINAVENANDLPMVVDSFNMVPVAKKVGVYRVMISISSFQEVQKS